MSVCNHEQAYMCVQVIGLCLTASHNAEEDNGIKISDPDGGVIDIKWFVKTERQMEYAIARFAHPQI